MIDRTVLLGIITLYPTSAHGSRYTARLHGSISDYWPATRGILTPDVVHDASVAADQATYGVEGVYYIDHLVDALNAYIDAQETEPA